MIEMLSELCRYLNNWFDEARYYGRFTIADGELTSFNDGEVLQDGQYFRIIDSVFNDGVYQYPCTELKDEVFEGSVWTMKVPQEVLQISDEIDAWEAQYMGADSPALSPYASESFGGYSYSKAASASGIGSAWQGVGGFADRLSAWRKPRCRY